jgi:glycosyltransferase involved in cell wall biosynthesis
VGKDRQMASVVSALDQTCWLVVPAFNEEENLYAVVPQIIEAVQRLGPNSQLLVIDDGSTDNSTVALENLTKQHPELKYISLGRNLGKAAALRRGFNDAREAGAEIVVMMDADGQDDPTELLGLVAKLDEGYDLVTGARLLRKDRFVKKYTSRIYNKVTSLITRVPGKDFNSGFKVMRISVARDVQVMMYGELHRYLTVIAYWLGHRVTEVEIQHHPRLYGSSKYGLARFWRGFVDLMTIKFIMSYENRPSHLFGGLGSLSLLTGLVISFYLTVIWVAGEPIGSRPLLIAGVLFILVGIQLIVFGLLAELTVYGRKLDKRLER